MTNSEFLNIGNVQKNRFHSYTTNAAGEVIGSSGNPLVWDPVLGLYTENILYNAFNPLGKSEKAFNKNLLYYDHFKMFCKKANAYNASVNVSGGKDKFDFSVGASILKQESNFNWKNLGKVAEILTEWKLRAAYGEAGIQPLPFARYPTLTTKTYGSSQAFYFSPAQPNPDLDVETSKEFEAGTDMTFKAGSNNWFKTINLAFTYWKRSTDNTIYDVDIAPSLGGGTFLQNAFTLASNGLQFSINAPVYSGKKLTWNTIINWGHQTSEITKVIGADVVLISSAGSTNYVLKPGLKIGQFLGYKMLRQVDAKNAKGEDVIPKAQQIDYEVASNGYVVNKTSKRPAVDPSSSSFGDPSPKFNMSFINDLSFGGFLTFNIQWDWVYKSHLYNQTKSWMYRDGISSDYEKPITMLTGEGVGSNAAGEIWFFFEQQLNYPVTLINANDFNRITWNKIDVLILPDGNYRFLNEKSLGDQFYQWIKNGGRVIALENAVLQLSKQDWSSVHLKKEDDEKDTLTKSNPYTALLSFENREKDGLPATTPGSIYKVDVDNTHPLMYGYPNYYYTLKMDTNVYDFIKENGWNAGVIKKTSQVAGFVGHKLKDKLKDGLLFGVQDIGRGRISYFSDNVLFRNFWENGKLMFCNAVFFVGQ